MTTSYKSKRPYSSSLYDLNAPTYTPNLLLNHLQQILNIKSDAHMCRILGCAHATIVRIRAKRVRIPPSLLIRIMEETPLSLHAIRALAGIPQPLIPKPTQLTVEQFRELMEAADLTNALTPQELAQWQGSDRATDALSDTFKQEPDVWLWPTEYKVELLNKSPKEREALILGNFTPTPPKPFMEDEIHAALDIAVKENGYTELQALSPWEIALDLIAYNVIFEKRDPEKLVPAIKTWLNKYFNNLGDTTKCQNSSDSQSIPTAKFEPITFNDHYDPVKGPLKVLLQSENPVSTSSSNCQHPRSYADYEKCLMHCPDCGKDYKTTQGDSQCAHSDSQSTAPHAPSTTSSVKS